MKSEKILALLIYQIILSSESGIVGYASCKLLHSVLVVTIITSVEN